jgi:DNA ligase (NAD+)
METILNKLSEEQQQELKLYVEASRVYYASNEDDDELMSDSEFDELKDKLVSYNITELTHFIESGIYVDNEGIKEVEKQTQEMISLKKEKYIDKSSIFEIKKFFFSILKEGKKLKYGAKYDGAALKIIWNLKTHSIEKILSRGGLDVTKFFKEMKYITDTIAYRKQIICGELIIDKKIFEEFFSDEFENPRNFVGKLLKQNDISDFILNKITFIPCTDGTNALDNNVWKEFNVEDFYNLETKISFFKSENFDYMCDGIVIAYDTEKREIKDNYPLNMLAIKFPAPKAKTKVVNIEWTQKKSGKLTPKLVVEPTKLDGSTITKANGYNYENLIKKHIGIGSFVEIEKSNDIIPIVSKVLSISNDIKMPDCGYKRSGKHLIALNLEESRQYKFILGLKLLQLDGIGPTISNQIGKIVDYQILDLFNQKYRPDICEILGGGANWKKFEVIYEIKTIYLDLLIALLQFDGVGPKIAKKIALLITKKSTDTSNISAEILATVCRGEGFKRIIDAIEYMKIHNMKILNPIEINEDTITFEMTIDKDLPSMSKDEFEKQLKLKYPNAIHTSLTKETKYLFTNNLNSNTSKMNKARKYNIKILLFNDALNQNL